MKTYKISDQRLRELVLEFDMRVSFGAIPQTIKMIQHDFISSIPTNDYFTDGEKQALNLYFESYSTLHSKNILLFESQINEGIASWFKSAVKKVKEVFGNIKEYVVKLWGKIKDTFKSVMIKFWGWIKGKVKQLSAYVKKKLQDAINGPKKAPLQKELKQVGESFDWVSSWWSQLKSDAVKTLAFIGDKIKAGITSKLSNLFGKAEEEEKTAVAENIFNKTLTEGLINTNKLSLILEEEGEDKGNFLTAKGWKNNWKKYVWNIVKILLNPIMGTLGVVGSWAGEKLLDGASLLISKLGGPGPYKFHILPELVMVGSEISGLFNSTEHHFMDLLKPYIEMIPGLETIIHFWHFGHKILLGYAIFETIHAAYNEIKGTINQTPGLEDKIEKKIDSLKESLSPEFQRMQQLSGLN